MEGSSTFELIEQTENHAAPQSELENVQFNIKEEPYVCESVAPENDGNVQLDIKEPFVCESVSQENHEHFQLNIKEEPCICDEFVVEKQDPENFSNLQLNTLQEPCTCDEKCMVVGKFDGYEIELNTVETEEPHACQDEENEWEGVTHFENETVTKDLEFQVISDDDDADDFIISLEKDELEELPKDITEDSTIDLEKVDSERSLTEEELRRLAKKRRPPQPDEFHCCSQCPVLFEHADELLEHLETHTIIRGLMFRCDVCEKGVFDNQKDFVKHKIKAHSRKLRVRKFKCKSCSAQYLTLNDLKKHRGTNHSAICNVCHNRFPTATSLNLHKKRVHAIQPLRLIHCRQCPNVFQKYSDFSEHLRMHKSGTVDLSFMPKAPVKKKSRSNPWRKKPVYVLNKPTLAKQKKRYFGRTRQERYLTDVKSNKKFIDYGVMAQVMCDDDKDDSSDAVVEVVDWTFACVHCSLKYQTLEELNSHESKNHSQETGPFVCDQCCEVLDTKDELTEHEKTHSEEKTFVCDSCPAGFTLEEDLDKHKAVHSHQRPHACDKCSARFKEKSDLESHLKTHPELADLLFQKYKCDKCAEVFFRKAPYEEHMKQHDKLRMCETCLTVFVDEVRFEEHKVACMQRGRKSRKKAASPLQPNNPIYCCNTCLITFSSFPEYCTHLCYHDVVQKTRDYPVEDVQIVDQPISSRISVSSQTTHAKQPVIQQLAAHISQRSIGQPMVSQHTVSQPIISQKSIGQPMVSQHTSSQPIISQQPIGQPMVSHNFVSQPILSQQSIGQPMVSQNFGSQPILSQQSIGQPMVSQNFGSQPILSQILSMPMVQQPLAMGTQQPTVPTGVSKPLVLFVSNPATVSRPPSLSNQLNFSLSDMGFEKASESFGPSDLVFEKASESSGTAPKKQSRKKDGQPAGNTEQSSSSTVKSKRPRKTVQKKDEEYSCMLCSFIVQRKQVEQIEHHLESAHFTYSCGLCICKFRLMSDLSMHRILMHSDLTLNSIFPCGMCSKTFPNLPSWRAHRLTHEDNCHVDCDQCPAKFRHHAGVRMFHLMAHKSLHGRVSGTNVADKKFVCDHCLKDYPSLGRMMDHRQEVCASDTSFMKCVVCPNSASLRLRKLIGFQTGDSSGAEKCESMADYDLVETVQTNSVQGKVLIKKCFMCATCSRTFASDRTLTQHMESHADFFCCGTMFTTELELRAHLDTCHQKATIKYSCWSCAFEHCSFKGVLGHRKIHGELDYMCVFCLGAFEDGELLTTHLAVHSELYAGLDLSSHTLYPCRDCHFSLTAIGLLGHQKGFCMARKKLCTDTVTDLPGLGSSVSSSVVQRMLAKLSEKASQYSVAQASSVSCTQSGACIEISDDSDTDSASETLPWSENPTDPQTASNSQNLANSAGIQVMDSASASQFYHQTELGSQSPASASSSLNLHTSSNKPSFADKSPVSFSHNKPVRPSITGSHFNAYDGLEWVPTTPGHVKKLLVKNGKVVGIHLNSSLANATITSAGIPGPSLTSVPASSTSPAFTTLAPSSISTFGSLASAPQPVLCVKNAFSSPETTASSSVVLGSGNVEMASQSSSVSPIRLITRLSADQSTDVDSCRRVLPKPPPPYESLYAKLPDYDSVHLHYNAQKSDWPRSRQTSHLDAHGKTDKSFARLPPGRTPPLPPAQIGDFFSCPGKLPDASSKIPDHHRCPVVILDQLQLPAGETSAHLKNLALDLRGTKVYADRETSQAYSGYHAGSSSAGQSMEIKQEPTSPVEEIKQEPKSPVPLPLTVQQEVDDSDLGTLNSESSFHEFDRFERSVHENDNCAFTQQMDDESSFSPFTSACSVQEETQDAPRPCKFITPVAESADHKSKVYKLPRAGFRSATIISDAKPSLAVHKDLVEDSDDDDVMELLLQNESRYPCEVCPATFYYLAEWRNHMRIHTGGDAPNYTPKVRQSYRCGKCSFTFENFSKFKSHVITHTGEKPFRCRDCPARFTQQSTLNRHKKIHQGDRLYKCLKCKASFDSYNQLRRHKRVHTNRKLFKCNNGICEESFEKFKELKEHRKIHMDDDDSVLLVIEAADEEMKQMLERRRLRKAAAARTVASASASGENSSSLNKNSTSLLNEHSNSLADVAAHASPRSQSLETLQHGLHFPLSFKDHSSNTGDIPLDQNRPSEEAVRLKEKPPSLGDSMSEGGCSTQTPPGQEDEDTHLRVDHSQKQKDCAVKPSINLQSGKSESGKSESGKKGSEKSESDLYPWHPFACNYCPTRFSFEGNRDSHMINAHSLNKPLKCGQCSASFSTKSIFTKHMHVHEPEYLEDLHKVSLAMHLDHMKSVEKMYKNVPWRRQNHYCPECPAMFRCLAWLKEHVRYHTKNKYEFQCPHCTANFPWEPWLKTHLTLHETTTTSSTSTSSTVTTASSTATTASTTSTTPKVLALPQPDTLNSESKGLEVKTLGSVSDRHEVNTLSSLSGQHEVNTEGFLSAEGDEEENSAQLKEGEPSELSVRNAWRIESGEGDGETAIIIKLEPGDDPSCFFASESEGCLLAPTSLEDNGDGDATSQFNIESVVSAADETKLHNIVSAALSSSGTVDGQNTNKYRMLRAQLSNPVRTVSTWQDGILPTTSNADGVEGETEGLKIKRKSLPVNRGKCSTKGLYIREKKLSVDQAKGSGKGLKLFTCNSCSLVFHRKSQLKAHKKTHCGVCKACGKMFFGQYALAMHQVKVHGEKPYQCDECPAVFSRDSSLSRHKKIHTGIREYSCTKCPKQFFDSDGLRFHMRTHNKQSYRCYICHYWFKTVGELRFHKLTHNGSDRPFKCPYCPMAYLKKSVLEHHVRVHTGERPFRCSLCPSTFTRSEYLRRHIRTHTGDRPYSCEICKARFVCNSGLSSHMRTHGMDLYECETCHQKFKYCSMLRKHRAEVHSQETEAESTGTELATGTTKTSDYSGNISTTEQGQNLPEQN